MASVLVLKLAACCNQVADIHWQLEQARGTAAEAELLEELGYVLALKEEAARRFQESLRWSRL